MHGFMLSKFMEFYRFMEVAHLWEKNNYADITDVKQLTKILRKRENQGMLMAKKTFHWGKQKLRSAYHKGKRIIGRH
jgi:hypothetical protein